MSEMTYVESFISKDKNSTWITDIIFIDIINLLNINSVMQGILMRLTIDQYSKQFKMSKEMIHSRLKTKKLNYIIEDGITYIIISTVIVKKETTQQLRQNLVVKQKTTVATVLSLYQKENGNLKNKILQLEEKIDRLIDDKEEMLRQERDRIEELYNKKDEQLKNILELVNAKMIMERQNIRGHTIHEVEMHSDLGIVELKDHLKSLGLKTYQRKVIKRRF